MTKATTMMSTVIYKQSRELSITASNILSKLLLSVAGEVASTCRNLLQHQRLTLTTYFTLQNTVTTIFWCNII